MSDLPLFDHQISLDAATTTSKPETSSDELVKESKKDGDADSISNANTNGVGADEASRLKDLTEHVRDQDELERDIGRQADRMLTEQADERDHKRLEKTSGDKERLLVQIRKLKSRLSQPSGPSTSARLQAEIDNFQARITTLDTDLLQIKGRIDERHENDDTAGDASKDEPGNGRMPNESQRDFLIRTGKITPFSKMGRSLIKSSSNLQDVMLEAEEGIEEIEEKFEEGQDIHEPMSHRNLLLPGFMDEEATDDSVATTERSERPKKRRRLQNRVHASLDHEEEEFDGDSTSQDEKQRRHTSSSGDDSDNAYIPNLDDRSLATLGEEDDEEMDAEGDDFNLDTAPRKRKSVVRRNKGESEDTQREDLAGVDDGDEHLYQARLQSWVERRSQARRKALAKLQEVGDTGCLQDENEPRGINEWSENGYNRSNEEECFMPHPTRTDTEFEGGYRIPGDIYPSLFDYQKTGVQWLWELYSQQVGGIIGDEMGLGKTIQIISFLAGLHYSKKMTQPIIVVAPATVMKQWVNEFHRWWPPFRVSILHTSGSGMIDIRHERQVENDLLSQMYDAAHRKKQTKGQKAARAIVTRVVEEGGVLVTTYSGLQTYAELLIPVDWGYAVLDEGHKIRNPNTAITIYCKELRTAHRIILSGTPMQNNLTELWSLFDFVFPMRLGTLINFRNQFEYPIRQGGYASATNLQVQTAMKCAETLKDTIQPYLLQRYKIDVAADLPKKSEQVLFCKLTKVQRDAYEAFLNSDDMKSIMNGKRQVLYGVDMLRKICNHPDLADWQMLSKRIGYNYGSGAKSGKMQVVKALLELWKETGHKTLLFCQYRITLDILEKYLNTLGNFTYRRMDGNTPIRNRQDMVDEFNKNPDVHVFLLTTKVGGLGVNLTGADRVIIYDPDWNPSTDVQARERAWRLGQKREVMIYRLMTAGTIEEKIYHRQIFKQFLTNKILKDPKQRQTFQMRDLYDLFSLGSADAGATETSELFQGTEVQFRKESTRIRVTDTVTPSAAPVTNSTADDPSDVRDMAGVASIERFYGEEEEERKAASGSNDLEARVMEGIFARSGVHSALEHDQIINGKKVITADPKVIEREAKKVAAEAAKELKKAGEAARLVPIGTPTWTGQFGSAGRPDEQGGLGRGRGRGGPASSSILAGLQNRQAANGSGNTPSSGTPVGRGSRTGTPGPSGKDFMKLIRDYLVTHGGKVHTQMLIDHFNRYCNSPERTAEFKEMLRQIASLEKGSRGRGRWVLKEEYKA
ncbi:MAG: hypothetical protein M1827_005873 [Pycnora praestabilis]|nr:MAG: hypothetical protein M1827_005873 [Pycnora praestabilis]